MKNYFILLAALMILGCSNKTQQEDHGATVSMSEKEAQSAEDAAKAADQLADIAEAVLASKGIDYIEDAKTIIDKALSSKPEHEKANFYNSLIVLALSNRGILAKAKASDWIKGEVRDLNYPGLFSLGMELPAGSKVFKTSSDVQEYIRKMLLPAVKESSKSLSYVSSQKATEIINSEIFHLIGGSKKGNLDISCLKVEENWQCEKTLKEDKGEFSVEGKRVVDNIDLEVLKGSLNAVVDTLRLVTAYKSEGSEDFIKKLNDMKKSKKDLTDEEVVTLLNEYPSLFELSDENELTEIAGSLDTTLRSALDLSSLRTDICPKINRDENLINSICITVEGAKDIEIALEALAGPEEITLGHDKLGQPVKIMLNASAFLNGAIGDLKELLPVEFDESGRAIEYNDPTMGGIFPDGDFVEKVKLVRQK